MSWRLRTAPCPTDQRSGEFKDPALTAFLGTPNDEVDIDFAPRPPDPTPILCPHCHRPLRDEDIALAPLYIGYVRLEEWVSAIDSAAPVYAYLLIEQEHSNEGDRRIDHHRLVVGKPDALNRVHYCRITLSTLVYINGVPFDPEHEKVLAEAKRVYEQVAQWLEQDFTVWRGMIAMLEGLVQTEGIVPHDLLSLLEESESVE